MTPRKRGRPPLSDIEKRLRKMKMFSKEWARMIVERAVLGLWNGLCAVCRAIGRFVRLHWREAIAFLALVLLATSAAYGVYMFSLLFVPHTFALITAGAFEATYIGLGVAKLKGEQRAHAQWISGAAVAVSIIYNTLAAIAHFMPWLPGAIVASATAITAGVAAAPVVAIIALVLLALLHGAPLALTAFFLSNLILHKNDEGGSALDKDEYRALIIERCIAEGLNNSQVYKIVGGDRTKTWALINDMRNAAS